MVEEYDKRNANLGPRNKLLKDSKEIYLDEIAVISVKMRKVLDAANPNTRRQ